MGPLKLAILQVGGQEKNRNIQPVVGMMINWFIECIDSSLKCLQYLIQLRNSFSILHRCLTDSVKGDSVIESKGITLSLVA
jgi:hypothetical protein